MGVGLLKMREPKSVTAGIRWRGQWDIIRDRSNERELEIEVIEDLVMDGGEVSSSSWAFWARNLSRRVTLSLCKKGCSRMSAILCCSSACAGR